MTFINVFKKCQSGLTQTLSVVTANIIATLNAMWEGNNEYQEGRTDE